MALAGAKGMASFTHGTQILPFQVLMDMMTGGSSGGGDLGLMIRIGGLIMIGFSVFIGFLVLLKGYVVHDFFNLFYRFFLTGGRDRDA